MQFNNVPETGVQKRQIQDDEGKILGVFKKEKIVSYHWTVRNIT